MKMLFRDYLGGFRLSNMKKEWKENTQVIFLIDYVAMIPLYTMINQKGMDADDGHLYLSVVVPMLFIFLSETLHPVRMPKIMYLCPMTEKERRDCIYRGYCFRVCIHMLVALLGLISILLSDCFDVLAVLEFAANSLVMSIFIPATPSDEKTDGTKWGSGKETIHMVFMIPAAVISNIVLAGALLEGEVSMVIKAVILGVLLLIQLPLTISYRKYIQLELASAVYYEGTPHREQ